MQIESIQFEKGVVDWDEMPFGPLPEVAFVGRSNVGKSSLLNALAGEDAARTSKKPGKTREFNFYSVNGGQLYFVDLPGYGYAKTSKTERERWGQFIGEYVTERPALHLVVHLIDSRHPPSEQDEDVLGALSEYEVPRAIALTKVDKLSGNERPQAERRMSEVLERFRMDVPVVLTSAESGRGLRELLDWVETFAG
ncbi:MAG: GTP-binding protein [Bacteroidetes bacterium QS_8_64_10]|nr:MAG: GTP-binding protein [Bacteroidetes bacterium QS_8_64_10]